MLAKTLFIQIEGAASSINYPNKAVRHNAEHKIPDEAAKRQKVAAKNERPVDSKVLRKTNKSSSSKTCCQMQPDV